MGTAIATGMEDRPDDKDRKAQADLLQAVERMATSLLLAFAPFVPLPQEKGK